MQGIQGTLGVAEDLNKKGLCQIQAQPFLYNNLLT